MVNMNPRVSEKAFHRIVREHSDRIYNLALMKSNQVSIAEDICQETFIRVYKGMAKFRNDAQLGTWIYRIALNVCHTMLKKESGISSGMIALQDLSDLELRDDENVEDSFYRDVRAGEIREAISALPRLQSDAITLYYLKEFQYTEVAEVMEIPLNTVKSHIRRAKENLRKLLMEVYDET